MQEIKFIPAGQFRRTRYPRDAKLRLKMVTDRDAGQAGFVVDDRSVRKGGPLLGRELGELRHELSDRKPVC